MSHDFVKTLGDSNIQFGSFNDRIYLMSLADEDAPEIVEDLISLAVNEDLSKIFAKVSESQAGFFLSSGFEREAVVPHMFEGEDGVFLSFYRYPWRKEQSDKAELDQVLSVAESKKGKGNASTLPSYLRMRRLGLEDAYVLASLYSRIFETYPFPISDYDFLRSEMAEDVHFMGVFDNENLIGAASAEISGDGYSAEMTDFAVNPNYRKMGVPEHCCVLLRMNAVSLE